MFLVFLFLGGFFVVVLPSFVLLVLPFKMDIEVQLFLNKCCLAYLISKLESIRHKYDRLKSPNS